MKYSVRRLCESGIFISLATVLSMLKIFEFSFGGSITVLSMLPIVLLSYRHGIRWGLSCGFAYSIIQILLGVNTISVFVLPGESQMIWWRVVLMCLLDYILAYTALGFGGLFRKQKSKAALPLGAALALFACYLFHVLSGALFFGSYAEWFFADAFVTSASEFILNNFTGTVLYIVYSLIYNGCYMLPEIVLTTIGAAAIANTPFIKQGIKN